MRAALGERRVNDRIRRESGGVHKGGMEKRACGFQDEIERCNVGKCADFVSAVSLGNKKRPKKIMYAYVRDYFCVTLSPPHKRRALF